MLVWTYFVSNKRVCLLQSNLNIGKEFKIIKRIRRVCDAW